MGAGCMLDILHTNALYALHYNSQSTPAKALQCVCTRLVGEGDGAVVAHLELAPWRAALFTAPLNLLV